MLRIKVNENKAPVKILKDKAWFEENEFFHDKMIDTLIKCVEDDKHLSEMWGCRVFRGDENYSGSQKAAQKSWLLPF